MYELQQDNITRSSSPSNSACKHVRRTPQTRPCRVEFNAIPGLRVGATDCRLHGLPIADG
eukprot:15432459-Alexandrium_andersonii.AAC.1